MPPAAFPYRPQRSHRSCRYGGRPPARRSWCRRNASPTSGTDPDPLRSRPGHRRYFRATWPAAPKASAAASNAAGRSDRPTPCRGFAARPGCRGGIGRPAPAPSPRAELPCSGRRLSTVRGWMPSSQTSKSLVSPSAIHSMRGSIVGSWPASTSARGRPAAGAATTPLALRATARSTASSNRSTKLV